MSVYDFGPFRLDAQKLLLTHGGVPVALGPKVVATLLALIELPGEVLAKGALLDRIWPEGFVDESNLAQNVHVLRKTFRCHGMADPIETIPRRGYRFTAPVCLADAVAAATARAPARRRFAAALAGAGFVAASLVLVASDGLGHRRAAPSVVAADRAQLYQIGRYYWNLRTRDGVRKSLGYFEQVVDTAPRDARGYAALADANIAMGDYCYGTHQPAVYFARARAYANTALALDPNSAEAHATLGFLALDRDDVRSAETELRHALALDPSDAPAHEWYGIALLGRGRVSDGLRHLRTAADLDPLSVTATAWLGSAAYASRRFGDAIAYSRQALELAPQRTDALVTLGAAYEAQGEYDRAIETFKRFGAIGAYYEPAAAALLAHTNALVHRRPDRPGALAAFRRRGHRMGTENAVRLYAARLVT